MIFLLLLVGFILTIATIAAVANSSKAKQYKLEYDDALLSGDRVAALIAGRKYYGALRGNNRVTAADEQAITNDILVMPKEPQLNRPRPVNEKALPLRKSDIAIRGVSAFLILGVVLIVLWGLVKSCTM